MSHSTRKLLLATLAVAQFLIGAGSGDRVVYFGASHATHTHCAHDFPADDHAGRAHAHGHSHGILKRVLGYLPVVVPVDSRHQHDSHDECDHVHIRGHDSGAASGPVVVLRPDAAARPAFLSGAAFAVAAPGLCASVSADGPRSRPPPAPPDAYVRLLI